MIKKILFFAFGLFAVPAAGFAQGLPCGASEAMEELARKDPSYARQLAEMDMRNLIISQDPALRMQQTQYTIPVVVHIMHDYGSSNITKAQVLDAIRVLNEDFNKFNADTSDVIAAFQPLYAKVGITFKLAQIDPSGNCTEGITRHYTPLTNAADNAVKNIVRWDPSKYLNVWVANTMASGSGGYSYRPCVSPLIDGIVLRNAQFGSIGTSSGGLSARTLTHEVGHYLNLPHTWGGTNTPGLATNCNTDDGIIDTPNTVGVSNQGCNLNASTCGNLDNVQNFMDYANCPKMFTLGQKAVILDALQLNCRTTLWAQNNLVATGTNDGFTPVACAPIVDFNANSYRICEGETVFFSDLSYNGTVGTRTWSFPGGTPSTSTDAEPQVMYNTPGVYPVTLVASNAAGTDTETKTDYIVVKSINTGISAPYTESFESPTFPNVPGDEVKSWEIFNETTNTWERTNAGFIIDGSFAMRVRHGFIGNGRVNELVTPNIDLSGVTQPSLSFKIAYSMPTSAAPGNDRLRVYVSTDCGRTWSLRMAKAGGSLSTVSIPVADFVPSGPDDWRTENANIPTNASQVMIKFESTSGTGNNLYLDAINVSGNIVGLESELSHYGLQVYPNPTTGQATISYQLLQAGQTRLSLTNALGQEIVNVDQTEQPGTHEHQLQSIAGSLPSGVYFFRLQTASKVSVQKIVIQ